MIALLPCSRDRRPQLTPTQVDEQQRFNEGAELRRKSGACSQDVRTRPAVTAAQGWERLHAR